METVFFPKNKWAADAGCIRINKLETPTACLSRLLHCLSNAEGATKCDTLDLYIAALSLDTDPSSPYATAYKNWRDETPLTLRTPQGLAERMDLIYADLRESEMRLQGALSTLKLLQPDKGDAALELLLNGPTPKPVKEGTVSSSRGNTPPAKTPTGSSTKGKKVYGPRCHPTITATTGQGTIQCLNCVDSRLYTSSAEPVQCRADYGTPSKSTGLQSQPTVHA